MADASNGQIQEFLRVLRRRRWQIVMPAIFVLALGTVFAVLVPKKTVIFTRVELLGGQRGESDPVLKPLADTAVMREVENVGNHLKKYSYIKSVVEAQAGLWPEYQVADLEGRQRVIERIQDDMWVSQVERVRNAGSTFIDIEFSDVSGGRAVTFLVDLIDKWVAEVIEADKVATMNLRDKAQDVANDRLNELNLAYDTFRELAREAGVSPDSIVNVGERFRDSIDPVAMRLTTAENDLMNVESDLAQAAEELEFVRETLEAEPELVPATAGTDFMLMEQRVQETIAELERERDNYTPAASTYKRLTREIREFEQRLEEERQKLLEGRAEIPNEAIAPLREDLVAATRTVRGLQERKANLETRIEDLKDEQLQRIDQYGELEDANLQVQTRKQAYQDAVLDLDQKDRRLASMDANPEPYAIVRPPAVEGAPQEPSAILLVLISAFGGLALGLALALAAEYARNSYRTVADVSQVLALPVLGTIDQIVTSVEARRIQARRAVVGLSSAVILGGLAWFTWVWAVTPDMLPIQVQQAIEEFRKLLM